MLSPNGIPAFKINNESSPNSIPQSELKNNLNQKKNENVTKPQDFESKAIFNPPNYKESVSMIKFVDEVKLLFKNV